MKSSLPDPKTFSHPFSFSNLLLGLAMGLALLQPSQTMAKINTVFTVPPYELNETVVGIEGWELRAAESNPAYGDPKGAIVIDSPTIGAAQPTTLHLKTLLENKKLRGLGEHFVVETQFALVFKPDSRFDGGLTFRFGNTSTTPFHFGFSYGEGGGLYFQGQGDRVIILSKFEVQQGIAYQFVFHVNLVDQTFRLLVTCPEDDSFRYESEEVDFQDTAPAIFSWAITNQACWTPMWTTSK